MLGRGRRTLFCAKKVVGRGCRGFPVAKKCSAGSAEPIFEAKKWSAEAAEHFLWQKSVRQGLPGTKFQEETIRMYISHICRAKFPCSFRQTWRLVSNSFNSLALSDDNSANLQHYFEKRNITESFFCGEP
jgi:hypothetical protein